MFVADAILISLRNFQPSHQQVLEKKKDRAAIMAEAWWETWGKLRWAPNRQVSEYGRWLFFGGAVDMMQMGGLSRLSKITSGTPNDHRVNAPKQMLNSRTFSLGEHQMIYNFY